MARPAYDVVVIGGGAGGLVVAAGAATLGAKVALVEKHRLGGDCLWTGCVPSKALLKSAAVAHVMRTAHLWGLDAAAPVPDLARVLAHVSAVVAEVAEHDTPEHFRGLGVEVIFGAGRFIGPAAFAVNDRTLTARAFVLATGSRPSLPAIPGLDQVPYLTNETLFDLREPVPALAVLGAGPIGCELGQALRRLGSEVTLIEAASEVLPQEDADVAVIVRGVLEAEGVRCFTGAKVSAVHRADGGIALDVEHPGHHRVCASHVLVATGRRPNVEELGLDAARVEVSDSLVKVDAHLRTTNARVFAIGDLVSEARFTHLAEHHAGVVIRQALFRMRWARPSAVVPSCTFTDPELARVGQSERQAKAAGTPHVVYRFPFSHNDRAIAERDTVGFAKLVASPRGKILGAAIVGPRAGELVAEYALAMQNGLKVDAIARTIHPYPTYVQTNRRVADQRLKAALTRRRQALLKRAFGWRGT